VLKKYLRNEDTAFVNDLYDLYILQNIRNLKPSPEALKTVLDQLAEPDSQWRTFVPSSLSMTAYFFKNWKRRVHPTSVEINIAGVIEEFISI
jgi:hypothetical protein